MTVASSERSARTARQVLAEAGAVTLPALRQAVDGLPGRIRHLVGVHFGWWDLTGAPSAGNDGKALRPALALLAGTAAGGGPETGVPAAVAVELVHNASLLHDDIIDQDRLRRGRPALWVQLGVPAAILAGDALFFLATRVLAETPPPLGEAAAGQLTAAVQQLIDGEYADILLESRAAVSVAECEAMAAGKTGSLIAAACGLGALAAGADEERVGHLRAFGTHVGVAFQLVDDCLGIWGDPVRTGKPAGSDLAARKKSLPIAAALGSGGAAGEELRSLYARPEPLSPAEVARAADLVAATGSLTWAVEQADQHIQRAMDRLNAADPDPTAAAELIALTQFVTGRDH
ncbi:polyprenyl synthetase family protein [Streptomyces sp. NPDC005209]|uniref:polyprenyl synthetase family protein n=1 Tax=Streptomyces sp. NPDC005209 TaxID=3156715 RepID=UPI0033ADB820